MAPNENCALLPPTENGYRRKFSRVFAESEDDEIVISGISGRFPNSKNVSDYEYNLYNKIDMVDDEETRWKKFNPEIPQRGGKINGLEKFDATFFGVHFKQAHTLDPQCRVLIEVAYEAILDAGINPKSLRGSRTGVYVGACISESEKTWFYEKMSTGGFGITGCSRAMLANRISYVLGLNGPSYVVDTACSSSLFALDSAFSALRSGEIDAAIVGGCNLTLHPYVTLQFARLGVLASDGFCRPFDEGASGYTRSESINCIYLQRKRDCKRIYGTLVYSKTNCDGFKSEGITYPSGFMQERLMEEFYGDLGLNPRIIGYLEAHSTGTVVGDPEECRAIMSALCKERTEPLLIGSVKSNIGHTEAASGICGIIKALFALQTGKVAPNINFKCPRKDIPAITEGRLKIVTDEEELKRPYIAVNGFGFGGSNAHILLKGCSKGKHNSGKPTDTLPRLVCWSSRTEEGVNAMLNSIESKPLDTEFIALVHNIQKEVIPGFVFRGYGLYSQSGEDNASCIIRDVQHYTGVQRPVVWVFSGMGSQWAEMGASLMSIPLFRESIQRCHSVLEPKGLDLINIVTCSDSTIFDNILNSFVGIAAVQIGIVDMLRALELVPDYIIGHSVGELGCAYADGAFTAEQMILAAYFRGKVSVDIQKIRGSMAAVGLGYKAVVKLLPPSIEVACHNNAESSTISGPSEDVEKFVAELKSKGIFAKEVPCSNIAYHSKYIAHMGPLLLKYLQGIVPNPKKRSTKWLSTSVPKQQWDQPQSELCSAEYHTNNLLNSVLFEETSTLLPPNALTIEVAPHGLLQAILKKSLPNAVNISLTQRGNKNNANFFLAALGKLYLSGVTLPIERLYPKVDFPVARGTSPISSLIRWEHSDDWFVSKFENIRSEKSGERIYQIGLNSEDDEFLAGHIIDGKVLIPATFYLQIVWETFSLMHAGPIYMDMPVEFSDVRFIRATQLTKENSVTLIVTIHHGTGNFEISEGGATVVTGNIAKIFNIQAPAPVAETPYDDIAILESRDFYKELRLRGYHYAGMFKGVTQARSDGLGGNVKWNVNWVAFMDALLQVHVVGKDSRSLALPTRLQKLRIFGLHHIGLAAEMESEEKIFEVHVDPYTRRLVAGGIEIIGLHASAVSRRKPPGIPVLESYQFIPHLPAPVTEIREAIRICVQTALENHMTIKMKVVEVDQDKTSPVIQFFQEALEDLPVVSGDLMFLSSQEIDLPGIHVEDGKLSTQANCMFLVSTNLLGRPKWVADSQASIGENGYLVSIETFPLKYAQVNAPSGFHILAFLPFEGGSVVLMRRIREKAASPAVVRVCESDTSFAWIAEVQNAITTQPVVLVAQNEQLNGLIGLVNCLRKEPGGDSVTCVFIDDPKAPPFSLEHPFYAERLKLGLAINIFRNGEWGTYRHLKLGTLSQAPKHQALYVDVLQRGDLSSLAWIQGSEPVSNCRVKVVYASLNFRDIMIASGRITLETPRLEGDCNLGFEFSGYGKDGKRYMGMKPSRALATHINVTTLTWPIPDNWTLADAASIPCVYVTVYMAFFQVCDIRKGKSILIHAGTGGIGQAAITVALAFGLEVFTTVGTNEKKQYLLKRFPQLKASHIGNSRDTSFEIMIAEQTEGNGVDFVLNSLSEEKLLASIRCVASKGHFLEIGKFDIMNDNKIGLAALEREISIHGVFADRLFFVGPDKAQEIVALITNGIKQGIITPIPTTVFKANEVEQAFRYMASGKHMGKVLIQIHDEMNRENTSIVPITPLPRSYFRPDLVYVVIGGLGGFGLELIDWMVLRNARIIVISSSRGISKPYQLYRIKLWRSYGVQIEVRTDDITTYEGCSSLLNTARKFAPIGGIFNLAVALRDAIFSNQTTEYFKESLAPKAFATKHLDEISRKTCPQIEHFVVFSSVSCGRGNAGQTNYGMANSVMERIMEKRFRDGLPAKAIQWGAVGEVGLVADMAEDKIDMEIGGTLQQRISSCLQELDNLFASNDPIVSSMVVAEKRTSKGGNIMETVMNIMGIRDIKSISLGSSLSETGMDSLMAVEIKQTLEREFEVFLSPQDLRTMTFQRLQEISDTKGKDSGEQVKLRLAQGDKAVGMALLLRNLGDELNSHHTVLPLVTKNSNLVDLNSSLIVPGLEGVAGKAWYNLALGLYSPAYVLQFMTTTNMASVQQITDAIFEKVVQVFKKNQPFYLIGYSFGTLVTMELAFRLEQLGLHGNVTLIDGSPIYMKKLNTRSFKESFSEEDIQILLLTSTIIQIFPEESYEEIASKFIGLADWNSRIERFLEYSDKQSGYSRSYIENLVRAMYNRIKIVQDYSVSDVKRIKSPITLIRPTDVSVADIDEDYELSKYTSGKVIVKFIEGDHTSMLDNANLPNLINSFDPNLDPDKCYDDFMVPYEK